MISTRPWAFRDLGAGVQVVLVPVVIAAATGMEYFDNAIFSMFAVHIAGGINASPDELVWATSAYAVAAVVGILQQQWWVERLGYGRYVSACLLLFAVAAVAAIACESPGELAFARGVQGYALGPMMSACRILIQSGFPAERRGPALRTFLIGILVSSALGPLLGGTLIALFGWRALFAVSGLMCLVIAPLALGMLPETGRLEPAQRSDAHLWPFVAFGAALGALQIVMQQVRFELFGTSPVLALLTLGGLGAIAWFMWHQLEVERPLIRLHGLRERVFQFGLILYVFYYYLSSALSFLISRFLEGGLGYPVENVGTFLGLTSLGSLAGLFIHFRYASSITNKKWLIVPGFLAMAFVAAWLAGMPPDVSQSWLVFPLVLRGLLLLFIAVPTANLTFRAFAIEEYKHSYRLKNMVRQLTYSFATATVIIFEQHRNALHWTRLTEAMNVSSATVTSTLDALSSALEHQGQSPAIAHDLALAQISRMVEQQVSYLSTLDGFLYVFAVALCGALFAIWQRVIK